MTARPAAVRRDSTISLVRRIADTSAAGTARRSRRPRSRSVTASTIDFVEVDGDEQRAIRGDPLVQAKRQLRLDDRPALGHEKL